MPPYTLHTYTQILHYKYDNNLEHVHRHGRKTAVVLALFLEAVSVIVSAVVPQFWMFIASRFFIGVSLGGTMLCCYVHLIELSGTSFVPYIIGLIEVSYMSGYLFLPMIAYFVREWRHLQLITSIPWIITISFYWLLPESPRWLITVGQNEEAIRVLTFIAKKLVSIYYQNKKVQ